MELGAGRGRGVGGAGTQSCPCRPQEKVRCQQGRSQGELASAVAHKVAQLKPKVKSKGLPAGLGPFPGGRVRKKLSRAKNAKVSAAARHLQPEGDGGGGRELTPKFSTEVAAATAPEAGKWVCRGRPWAAAPPQGRAHSSPGPPRPDRDGGGILEKG